MSLPTATGTLIGTLTLPAAPHAVPLAVLIAGSGPTDRDGNTSGASRGPATLRLLAESLAAHGIATVRYDKRGVGASRSAAVSEAALRFEMYADDAAAWVQQLRGDERFSSVVLIGHSEGSLLGMLAAQQAEVDGFVSIAGVARRADQVIREQLARAVPPALLNRSDGILAQLVRGDTVAAPPPALAALFRPSVQPYLISWFRHAGAAELPKLRMPVLIVQGTHDVQVPAAEATQLAAAAPSAELLMVDGMDHVLKLSPMDRAEQLRTSYVDPALPLAPALVTGVVRFIRAVEATRSDRR